MNVHTASAHSLPSVRCLCLASGVWLLLTITAVPALAQRAEPWQAVYTGKDATGEHVLGLWGFDVGQETADGSGRGSPLSLEGAAIHPDGRFGGCLEGFPGWPVQDKRHAAVVPSRPELSPSGAFTAEMWLKPKAAFQEYAANVYLLDKKYVAHTDYQLILDAPGQDGQRVARVVLGFGRASDRWSSDPLALPTGVWQHLAFTYDGAGTVRFFLNGQPVGGGSQPGRGSIAPGKQALSIGDRLGSYYAGFAGYLDQVRLSSGVREFRALSVTDATRRHTYVRGEPVPTLQFQVTNERRAPLAKVRVEVRVAQQPVHATELPTMAPGAVSKVTFPFDTHLRPDRYLVTIHLAVPGDDPYHGEESFPVVLVPRPLSRMPVVMWGVGGIDEVLRETPRLKAIGFTHSLGLSADYDRIWKAKQPVSAISEQALPAAVRMLDEALAQDLGIIVSLSPGSWAETNPDNLRVDRQGKPYQRKNLAAGIPGMSEFFYNVGASVAQTWGEFPALQAALINSELRDGTAPSFHERERAAFRKYAGFDIPNEVAQPWGVDYRSLKDIPSDRVVPDDHRLLTFYRWFWKTGDGWNDLQSAVHRGFHSTGRPDLWTFFDPAVRVPAIYGSGGDVDYISHWTYSYPDPIRIGLCADELLAMAAGAERSRNTLQRGPGGTAAAATPQRIMKMTQLIWYRSQTAPPPKAKKDAPATAGSPWEDFDPDAAYITIAPMHLREAFWMKIARPVRGIMYHGWQSLVPGEKSGYRYTHRETQQELARLVRETVQPLGPMLLEVPAAPADVAVLESFTSQVFTRKGTYGWGHSWVGDLWHALQYAHLQADIVYDEAIQVGTLDRYRVLVMPDCDVLSRSVVEQVHAFQKRGGLVVGDSNVCPAIKPDIVLKPIARTKQADEDKAALLKAAAELRKALDGRYQRAADADNPEVIVHRRRFGDSDYLFVVNDRREFGTYVGQHKLVMENGLSTDAVVTMRTEAGAVYDLRRGRQVATARSKTVGLTFPVHLGPCDGGLFLITPRPLAAVRIAGGDSTSGVPLEFRIEVVDDAGKPVNAVIPLKVELRDPDGRSAELSGYHAAKAGLLQLKFEPAPNDIPGIWELRVEDLASGLTQTHNIRLTQGRRKSL